MKSPKITQGQIDKVGISWMKGANSIRNPWVLDDAMYRWGVNVVNRGGLVQTRPGRKLLLTLPAGNLQGYEVFTVDKTTSDASNNTSPIAQAGTYLVAAVDGKIYASKFPLTQPADWQTRRLSSLSFNKDAQFITFCKATKATSTNNGNVSLVGSYSVLMIQDNISAAGYWDGEIDAHTDENSPKFGTPTGSWMAFSGNRLWVARGNALLASDLLDPLTFQERVIGTGRGDYKMPGEITGMINTIGADRQANLVVFTSEQTFNFLSYIPSRDTWGQTPNFQTTLFPSLGCVAGLSVVNHAGLLWWYSHGGLVSSDSATTAFLTSRIKYRDLEMAQTKSGLSKDISGICACSFESYLLVSVPSGTGQQLGEGLNTNTMVLDYAVADELASEEQPAWQGVWTGTRPVKWVTASIDGVHRCFQASIDYQALGGSVNHLWEDFQPERYDSYDFVNSSNAIETAKNPIYCSMETKLYGDGLDLKAFRFATVNLSELGGVVNFRASYRGTRGSYKEILRKKIIALLDANGNAEVQKLIDSGAVLVPQNRRLYSEVAENNPLQGDDENGIAEGVIAENVDRYFSLYFQWCGQCGVESYSLTMEPAPERITGVCEPDEDKLNVVTQDGKSFSFSP